MSIAANLLRLRKIQGLTQLQLGERIWVHFNQVQRYESRASQPMLNVLRPLAVAFGVSADVLLFDKDERGPAAALRLQFEALRQYDEEELQVAKQVQESLILKHQAKRMVLRTQHPLPTDSEKKCAGGRR